MSRMLEAVDMTTGELINVTDTNIPLPVRIEHVPNVLAMLDGLEDRIKDAVGQLRLQQDQVREAKRVIKDSLATEIQLFGDNNQVNANTVKAYLKTVNSHSPKEGVERYEVTFGGLSEEQVDWLYLETDGMLETWQRSLRTKKVATTLKSYKDSELQKHSRFTPVFKNGITVT